MSRANSTAQRRPASRGAGSGLIWVATGAALLVGVVVWVNGKRSSPPPPPAQPARPAVAAVFAPTVANPAAAPGPAPAGMVWIPGGEFSMGAADPRHVEHGGHDAMNDTRPIHRVSVDPFWMDATEVTNEQFARFVKATGYVTVAERKPTREEFPDRTRGEPGGRLRGLHAR